jgi:hypothetical protein
MTTKLDCTRLLQDEELADHLLKGHTLVFKGLGQEWQQIERQVERLGFGEAYFVSQLGCHECSVKLSPTGAYDQSFTGAH